MMEWAAGEDSCLGQNALATHQPKRRIFDSDTSGADEDGEDTGDSFATAKDCSSDVLDFIVEVYKYVDDTTLVEAVELDRAVVHFTEHKAQACSRARYTELVANSIAARATSIGMRVNCQKTQLLLVSPPNGFENSAYINLCNEKVESSDSLKLLGFVFGKEPNVSAHVREIKKKYRARFWALIHLKNAGFSGDQILCLFNIYLRPVIEYCSAVYHSLLTAGQSDELERLQRQVVRLAYGWNNSYEDLCAIKNIDSLKKRREDYLDRFTEKTLNNERFSHWYPVRERDEHQLRNRRNFEETRARTSRYYNSPLAYLRRRANDLFF